jgi:hypothetical protein
MAHEFVLQFTTTAAITVTTQTSTISTFSIVGLLPGDLVELNQTSHVAGISATNQWVSAPNTLSVQFMNSTGGSQTIPVGTTFIIGVERADNVVNNLPVLSQIV